jgi:dipeptidyl aminopeptidase/acylaminoacyl peptidase
MNTPTLIFQGEDDPRIPSSQSLLLYRLLQGKGVPTDLRFFPNEGHVFSHPLAVNDMLNRSISWLKLYCDIEDPSP